MQADLCLFSRPGCHLCEDMIMELESALHGKGLDFRVIDIDNDPQLIEKYGTNIPVLTLNGILVCQHFLDTETLYRELSKVT